MRALRHRENLKTRYQERALDLQSLHTNWKDTSYDSILVVVDRLKKMLRDEPVQILIDAPRLPRLDCQRLRLSLHLQVLVPPVPLSSSTAVTAKASPTKKISAPVPDSIRNLMTACRKNLPHGLDIANPFPPDL